MDYGIIYTTPYDIHFSSITDILKTIYYSDSPYTHIQIKSSSLDIDVAGELLIARNRLGLYEWHVDTYCLGDDLFNHTNNELNINIKHLDKNELKEFEKKKLEAVS